jgi:HAD superfamily hydrolase (TIGR01509 family)
VIFDVGETLVDETGMWERAADAAGVPRFTFMGVLGGLAARGEQHRRVWDVLGVAPSASAWSVDDLYPDVLPCLERLRSEGLRVGAVGNTPAETEELLRPHVDVLGSSGRWGVEKPSPEFFARVVAAAEHPPAEIAYVGDRVDNDARPAREAGMVAVHIRRGPWGYLHNGADVSHVQIDSLDELPEALARA